MAKSSFTNRIQKMCDFRHLLKSRLVLYFFFFLSLVNLYTFVSTGNHLFAAVFILVGFLAAFFSKNMIVILFCALVISNILRYGTHIRHMEGMEDNSNTDDTDKTKTDDNSKTEDKTKLIKSIPISVETIPPKPDNKSHKKNAETPENPKAPVPEEIENAKADVKGLLELENELMDGIQKMQPILEKAKITIDSLNAKINAVAK